MIGEMQSLLDGYWKWLKDQTSLRAVDDWIEITTPYLDRHNDCIQIYARRSEHGYLLTDDGYVLEDLEQSGCTIDDRLRHPQRRATGRGRSAGRHGCLRREARSLVRSRCRPGGTGRLMAGSRMIRVPVKPELLRWARHRAGLGRSEFPARMADELGLTP